MTLFLSISKVNGRAAVKMQGDFNSSTGDNRETDL